MTFGTTRDWLCGAVVAMATPFHEDFSLDLDGLTANIEAMIRRGMTTGNGVLLVGGAAGEFPTLSVEERRAVMRTSVEAAAGRVPIMASIQHTDIRVTIDLVKYAGDHGVSGVQHGATYYYPATEDDFFRLTDEVSRATRIPLMAYSTWWEGGIVMTPAILRRLAEIEHIEAVKWSAPSPDGFTMGAAAVADRLVLIDNYGAHVWGHLLGVRGFVTHVGNFWPEYTVDLWHELEARDYQAVTRRLADFKWAWSAFAGSVAEQSGGEGPFIKAALEVVGMHAGPPRLPSARATPEQMTRLRALFAKAGVPAAEPVAVG